MNQPLGKNQREVLALLLLFGSWMKCPGGWNLTTSPAYTELILRRLVRRGLVEATKVSDRPARYRYTLKQSARW